MSTIFSVETSWLVNPDNSSVYEIYNPDDQLIIGNGINNTKKWDLVDFTDLEGDAPKGSILFVYKEYLCISGDPNFPHRIWISDLRNAEGWRRSTLWLDLKPEDGGKINGAVIVNDEAVISKSNGRKYGWRIHDDGDAAKSTVRIIEDDKGVINPRAETVYERVNYYLDRNGVFTVPASEAGGLSYIVDEIIKAIPKSVIDDIAMGSNNGKLYITLGDITLDLGDTVNITNAVLVYDAINEQFYLRDNMSARCFTRFIDNDNEEFLYFGDVSGKVWKLDSGTKAGASNIVMRIRTPAHFQELGKLVHIENVKVFTEDPDGTIITYRTDITQPFRKQVGTITQQPWQSFEVGVKGKSFQMEFIHANATVRPTIKGYEITYRIEE